MNKSLRRPTACWAGNWRNWGGFRHLRRLAQLAAFSVCHPLLCETTGHAQNSATAPVPAEIKPPFNLKWGEPSDRLETLIIGAGGKVVSRHPARGGREAIEVSGLPQDGLKKTIFYFKLGALTGVELVYQTESWAEERYDALMSDMRRRISDRYGDGQQIARRTEKVGVNNVTQTVTGYKWVSGGANVQLIYFSASDPQNAYRIVSVHYNAF
jgi:hypothetical protein